MTALFTQEERVAAGRRYARGIDFTLQLPGNTKFVAAGDIPGLFAAAIHPVDVAGDKIEVVSLRQPRDISIENAKTLQEAGWKGDFHKVAGEALPDDVIAIMNARCAPLPPISLPMPKAQWQKYADALAANVDTPKIEYRISLRDTKKEREAIREGVERVYRQQLYLAVYSGEFTVVTSHTFLALRVKPPTCHDQTISRERWLFDAHRDKYRSLDGYQMRFDDFVTFAATLGIECQSEEGATHLAGDPKPPAEVAPTSNAPPIVASNTKSKRKNDWKAAMTAGARDFEAKNGRRPDEEELWHLLCDFKGPSYTTKKMKFDEETQIVFGGDSDIKLTRTSHRERFKRLFTDT